MSICDPSDRPSCHRKKSGKLAIYIRDYQIDNGVRKAQAYSVTIYIMCGLLLMGFLCNFAMLAVEERYFYRGSTQS